METKFLGIKNVLFSILNKGEKDTSDYAIAYYILSHHKHIKDINIIDMAVDCYMDRSTIRRFFQKNGFGNFQEFKQKYSDEFEPRCYKDQPYLNYNDYIAALNSKLQNMIDQYALKRDKSLDINNVNDLIHQARDIVLMGDESFCGNMHTIQQYFLTVEKVVFIVTSGVEGNPILQNLSEDDCILVLSLKGDYYKAIRDSIKDLPCTKILLTLLAEEDWRRDFDCIGQLTRGQQEVDEEIYRKYAMAYYIDIMLNTYKMKYKGG